MWNLVPNLYACERYAVLGDINTSVWYMERKLISSCENGINRRGDHAILDFPNKFCRREFQAFIKAKKIIRFKEGSRIIAFLQKVHDANSFTLLPLNREQVSFVGVTPDRKTIINMWLNVGIIGIDKYLFRNIMPYHG